jgi:endonuclease
MPTYDRPTKELMREFAQQQLVPGQSFTSEEVLAWFTHAYPKTSASTVRINVERMAVNARQRLSYRNVKPGAGYDLFFKLENGRFRLWDPERDPAPIYRAEVRAEPLDDEDDDDSGPSGRKFAFEQDLQNYLVRNLHVLEDGLRLYEDDDGDVTGLEFPAGSRFIDILAVDRNGGFVVIELKVSRGYDRTIGQLLRYMAWVEKNLADGKAVRGAIVASEITEDLELAASRVAGVELWEYAIAFQIKPRAS